MMARISRQSQSPVVWISIESLEFLKVVDRFHSKWNKGERAEEEKTSWEQRLASAMDSASAKKPLSNRQPEMLRL
jgi:hypothetical protein